jgi:hypothetical protein
VLYKSPNSSDLEKQKSVSHVLYKLLRTWTALLKGHGERGFISTCASTMTVKENEVNYTLALKTCTSK